MSDNRSDNRIYSKKDLIQKILSKTFKNPSHASIPPYKLAKTYVGKSEWHIAYYWWSRMKKQYLRERVYVGVRGLSVDQRTSLLQDVAKELNKVLKRLNKEGAYRDETPRAADEQHLSTMLEWATYASTDAKTKKVSDELRKNFSKLAHNLKLFYEANPLHELIEPWMWTDKVMEEFVEFLQARKIKGRNLAGKTLNDLIYSVDKLLEYLAKKKIMAARPSFADLRVSHPKNETEKYPPLTHEEKEKVFAYYREHYPEYYLYLLGIYYTCIRPGELHRLQVHTFNLKSKTIYVKWLAAKNGLSKYVQILEPYREALLDAGVQNLPQTWFLFGANCKPSSEQFLQEDYSTKHWYRHAKKIGLPEGKTPYGLKHTFNIDYVENNRYNIDWEWLRRHNRHATVQQTQEYISELTAYFLDETKSIILNYHK